MKIGVLIDRSSWYWRDLQRAASTTDRLVPISFPELDGAIGVREEHRAGDENWRTCDALLVRTMPPGSLEQVVLRMDLLGQWHEEGKLVLNPPRAMEIAVDKYLCSARLARAGLTIPATIVCQTWQQAMLAYEKLGGDLVVKPIFGGEGRGILRVEDSAGLAQRTFQTLQRLQAVMYLQPFIPHEGFDYRVFVLGEASYVMRRRSATDWRTNLSRGATAEPVPERGPWVDLGRRAASAVGAPIAGVDILPGQDGRLYVLEVNAVPGWRGLQAISKVDLAAEVLAYVRASAR